MNPGHPRWRHGPLACYHLLEGNRREALEATRAGAATARRGGGVTLAAALRLKWG